MRLSLRPITEFSPEQIPVLKVILNGIEFVVNGHIGTANLEDSAVETAKIADLAVTKAKALVFVSGVRVGTGAQESIAHGLGTAPTLVLASIQDTNNLATVAITEGTHTATNVLITVTNTASYKLIAWA